jgi:hypothetical protein
MTVGCVTKSADFAVVGTKKIDLNMQEFELVGENITGESTGHMVFIFPSAQPTIDEAVRNALQKVKGDIMTDASVYHKSWMIPPFYAEATIEVRGTVWKMKGKP